jgi:hypothetical protein
LAAVLVTVLLYVVFSLFLDLWFIVFSAVFALIGVPIGYGLMWLLESRSLSDKSKQIIQVLTVIVYGLLFSWLSFAGIVIGGLLREK